MSFDKAIFDAFWSDTVEPFVDCAADATNCFGFFWFGVLWFGGGVEDGALLR